VGHETHECEYTIVKRPKSKNADNEKWLNEVADQGWELVAVSGETDWDVRPISYFRRPRANQMGKPLWRQAWLRTGRSWSGAVT
jgi:hypothetical protein